MSCLCDDIFYKCLQSINSWSASLVITAYGLTYPTCIEEHFELLCVSPQGDYNSNPCAGYRCASNCEKFIIKSDKYVEVDSKFKIHQLQKDREEANKEMNHLSAPPTVLHIFNRSP